MQNAFPFFTATGVSSVMMPWLYYGFTVILEDSFDVIQTLETIQRERSMIYFAAPSMLIFILDHPRVKEFDTSSIQQVIYGGSAMPEEVIRRLLDTWPGVKLCNAYGLTEGGTGGTCLDASDAIRKMGSIGLPFPSDQEVRIVDDQDKDVGMGQVGEIVIRGPNIMKEYYKDPEATRGTLKNDWLHTGDLGYYDEDGYFYYTDRKKDMIVRGGFNVYSVEVENVLYEHDAVKQCAVVAKPHPKLGEDVLAFVVLVEGKRVSAEELIEFCSNKLADFKRPREIRFAESLPINAMGKVDKKAIRASYLTPSGENRE
jgi:acyl-CoA synthetase (AMP-forming)/AMP-acid ligase II